LSFVGIIANPASGKDIRRLVAHATVVNNQEKVSIVRRLLLSLFAAGVDRVEIMPDHFGIGVRALHGLCNHPEIVAATSLIRMELEATADDSLRAAQYLRDAGAGCIVSLGGDGTCRIVAKGLALPAPSADLRSKAEGSLSKELALPALSPVEGSLSKELALSLSKGCNNVPVLAISTGTNNVVPTFVEGTVAGLAAAYVALHPEVERERLCYRHKRLLVYVNGAQVDQALVEVALVSTAFTGARAVWQADSLRQVFCTRAQPTSIGLSAVVGVVHPVSRGDPVGASATIVPDGQKVISPLAPGSVVPVGIGEITDLEPGVRYAVRPEHPAVLALDGEREIVLRDGDRAEVTLQLDGPWFVDVERTLLLAVAGGAFLRS
jgi:predicted polyphosphate/ATP-dependent NAD kinase